MAGARRTPIAVRGMAAIVLATVAAIDCSDAQRAHAAEDAPKPLLAQGTPVDWWFAFKFNSSKPFASCGTDSGPRTCIFGGKVQTKQSFGQQFAVASSVSPKLDTGAGCLGATVTDPVGATFEQVYNGSFFYVIWNDQFYGDPHVCGKSDNCDKPWGHSKGMLAWNDAGDGLVMQVSTPSWPGSGSNRIVRKTGNTLGCIKSNNNLRASQHFFALKLNKNDVMIVLKALRTASVATDPTKLQVVSNGGPREIRDLVLTLGKRPEKDEDVPILQEQLSSGVRLIAKPSSLHVPPWQMVSALLSGASERAATWWTKPKIPSTTKSTTIKCWDEPVIGGRSGPVAIALTGEWQGNELKLYAPSNHAKIGVTSSGNDRFVIFGDLNQQGSIAPSTKCDASQNGRGGMFFVLKNTALHDSVSELIEGDTAKTRLDR
jgi:hypothetical protein